MNIFLKDSPPMRLGKGFVFGEPDVKIKSLKSGGKKEFEINIKNDFLEYNKMVKDENDQSIMMICRLLCSFNRSMDNKQFKYTKIYYVFGGDILLTIDNLRNNSIGDISFESLYNRLNISN